MSNGERRRWWRTKPAEYTAVITLAALILGIGRVAFASFGFGPLTTPDEKLDSLIVAQAANKQSHLVLDQLPNRVTRLEMVVDSMRSDLDDASQERAANLYLTCEIAKRVDARMILPTECRRLGVRRD